MHLSDILTPENILVHVDGVSKKRVLELISDFCASQNEEIDPLEAFECLVAREKLGGTGLGCGVAIPHGRLEGLKMAVGVLLQLEHPIDFGSMDKKPVDLVFGMFVPEKATDDHLELLSSLAKLFCNAPLREKMRNAPDAETLYQLVTNAGG
jgi:PTS system nitrogen regulatory IIA component